ncbi:multidrug effflux MFS transporter [Corynebacterium marinum]|uniref:Integral membrane transport protein n=1 Tax=Corynebacterium marinum DSM 44953 TaxID=1224162 RepID=A0A0B6TWL1_9CORY|nr:multidrug effflux MFS transporter [Corynebacterium marinum]AJK69136.1 integral membrane transport protein [Corynebacterium marinum DSM 44953]GGO17531.1 Bcr/CflA family drug resistance efflux transporter [Corynebacterium marinum]
MTNTTRPAVASGPKAVIPPIILGVLALVSAVEPLSINMYLSGLPALGRDLDLSQAGAQLTLTFFLAGMAIGQLVTGPLSDARGRRGLFLAGVVLLVLATAASALATHAWILFASRFVMGLAGGTAVVLARAVAGDLAKGPELARVFSLLMLLGGLAPVIGPVLGGLIVDGVGWRGVFWVLAGLNLLMAAAVWRFIPETLPAGNRSTGGLRPLLAAMGGLLRDRAYVGFTLGFIFSFSTMFAYVSASPFILQEYYGFTPVQFSVIFAVNTTGMFLVALTNARLVRRVGPLPLAKIGNAVLLAAVVYLVVAALLDASRWFILAGLFVVVASMGVNFANNSALAISRAGKVTGSASAFMGSGQFIMAGLLSPLVGLAAAAGMSQPVAMTVVMLVTAVIAAAGVWGGARVLGRE